MKIGNLKIKYPIFLAPMAAVTDRPFRIICKNMGAGLVYTEFVSANGIVRENLKTLDLIRFNESERPIAVQIFGENPLIVGQSAGYIYKKFKPDIIDINFGCPVPKVTKRGAGSGAMKNITIMEEITRAVIENVPIDFPITVKMRAGWDKDNIISTKAGIMLEKIGVKAITLHPRTSGQLFSGHANWSLIKDLKENTNIPIIGNGDVRSVLDYIKIIEETKCDAVMIARACLGNPWIFKDIINYIRGKEKIEITIEDKIKMCRTHYDLLKKDKHEKVCLNLTKKHFNYYLKGFSGASMWRKDFMAAKDCIEIEEKLLNMENEYFTTIV